MLSCSSIVSSRKRKLLELFLVNDSLEPVPRLSSQIDPSTATQAQTQYLERNDITLLVYFYDCVSVHDLLVIFGMELRAWECLY